MSRFFEIRAARESRYTGDIQFGFRWRLAGLRCPECQLTASGGFTAYPSVDLSSAPVRAEFAVGRVVPPEEFLRLREQLGPYVPRDLPLPPGVWLGPLTGVATGSFGSFFLHSLWTKLVRREAWESLRAEGLRGVRAFPVQLHVAQAAPPDLMELEVPPRGHLHPECTPARPPPCSRCGLARLRLPDEPVLDLASLPPDTDLFVLSDFETVLIGTERFVAAVERLGLDDLDVREVPAR
ncbi:double-CXXCG motif protein [Archangium primigenium]|uniref:SitI6 family double-CXXCG motif immunity protein n=1 Tax=[Archangium] primigenium TaxID=2792470 RepID=UPI0019580C9A|nr:double-CXXCG motif protein [Archangium primigenium]MBM7112677.1 hypothetical protein [Archangium primigenium]